MSDYSEKDLVTITVPADVGYVATLRLAAASLAARCELTIDDIEDLRLAVDEACALLLPHGTGGTLEAHFILAAQQLTVTVQVGSPDGTQLDQTGFAWTVLGALASDIAVDSAHGLLSVTFAKRRTAGVT